MSNPIDNIFYPKSIAVVGASTKKDSLSYGLINNLVYFGYTGCIYPINPKAEVIHNFKVYKSLTEIKDTIDLAVIMVAKNFVLDAIEDCHKKNIHSVVLITAGFRETGAEGAEMENRILEKTGKPSSVRCFAQQGSRFARSLQELFARSKSFPECPSCAGHPCRTPPPRNRGPPRTARKFPRNTSADPP